MPKITAIKPAVKTAGRFNLFVDGKYSFSLDELQLVDLGLKRDQEIDGARLDLLKDESIFGKAYGRALELVYRRPRSIKEMQDYARRKKWPEELGDRVIKKLLDKEYLDDAKFAEIWIRHRVFGKPTSSRVIKLELRQKGVADEHINAAFDLAEDFNEDEALVRMIEKKQSRYQDPQKLIAYLARQGFSYDRIKAALQKED